MVVMRYLLLHLLEDSLKGSPTWSMHEGRAERGVVGDSNLAEESFFVLEHAGKREKVSHRQRQVDSEEAYLAQDS